MICTYQIGLCWSCREGGGLVLPAVPRSLSTSLSLYKNCLFHLATLKFALSIVTGVTVKFLQIVYYTERVGSHVRI